MTRTIKFRAWNEENKIMIDLNRITPLAALNIEQDGVFIPFNGMPIMQFTGLLDRNGKEIYEGDVLRFTEVDEDSCMGREDTHVGKVVWVEEIAQWRFIYPSGQRRELHLVTHFPQVIHNEVIGNIYEHPELLNT